jgi:hypothetical protein
MSEHTIKRAMLELVTLYPALRKLAGSLLVQDNTQEGIVDVDLAVVFDEAQLPEFVHEKIDPWACRADHLRQHFLRYFGKDLLRLARRVIARQQQESARQPLLAGVKELVDQVLLDSEIACQYVGDKAVRKLVFPVEHANHFVFLDDEDGGGCNSGRSRHANGLAGQAAFPKKITRSQNRYDRLFAGFVDYGKLHAAFLNVHDILCGIALREDGFFSAKLSNLSPQAG